MLAIYKREVQSYFSSVLGYIIVAVLTFFFALFFNLYNIQMGYSSVSVIFQTMLLFFILTIPILTMRTFAEERRQKTDQLLLTSPVSISGIVIAKYLSVMTVLAIPFIITCAFPLIISILGEATLLKDYCTIFAAFCLCSLFVSIGVYISSLTENQIVAVFVTVCIFFVLYLFDAFVALIPETPLMSAIGFLVVIALVAIALRVSTRNNGFVTLITIALLIVWGFFVGLGWDKMAGSFNTFLGTFSVVPILRNFMTYSVFDIKGIFLYLSFSALFLFLTVQSIQKRRWN